MTDSVFRNCFVTFVDVLGFGGLVAKANNSDNTELASQIDRALSEIQTLQDDVHKLMYGLEASIFSDSVIIAVDGRDPEGFCWALRALTDVVWTLLTIGILVRGGIAKGPVSQNAKTPWGMAINQAYNLENTVASFPRIVFAGDVVPIVQQQSQLTGILIERDADGVWFLDVIATMVASIKHKSGPAQKEGIAQLKIIQNKLNTLHEDITTQPNVFDKIEWLCCKWNDALLYDKEIMELSGESYLGVTTIKQYTIEGQVI